MTETKLDQFIGIYEKALEEAVASYPGEYSYPLRLVPAVVNNMRQAIKRGSYNKDSRAIKATCKILKLKHTYKDIAQFLRGE